MKIFVGKIISHKLPKMAVVAVERTVVHPVYLKRYRRLKKYHVFDEFESKVGEMVKFVSCRPKSKLTKWRVIK